MSTDEEPNSLKAHVLAIADIAKSVPENLQAMCFELLLRDLLDERSATRGGRPPTEPPKGGEVQETSSPELPTPPVDESSDIGTSDLHVKARAFLNRYGLKIEDINQILYKEGERFLPLFEDLKTTRMSESQIRVALLDALTNGLRTGEFAFDGERVRQECTVRKCYDGTNFTSNFKNNASLFDGFDSYKRAAPVVKLSEDGRRELAELVRELQ